MTDRLKIENVDLVTLAKEYQTPLYVINEKQVENNCEVFYKGFKSETIETEILYASKAFLTIEMAKLIYKKGLSLDVVSLGELYTAQMAKFPFKKIYFHGNQKSDEELIYAINQNIGAIIIDNFDELERIKDITKGLNKKTNVMIRINPGVEAHTHEYIKTTTINSKFGIYIKNSELLSRIKEMIENPYLNFLGIHSHIGSQIFSATSFLEHAKEVINFALKIKRELNKTIDVINFGGGFGVRYVKEDTPIDLTSFLSEYIKFIETTLKTNDLEIKKIMIEPGRAIVADAGLTLYKVGTVKETQENPFLFVNGSMADHIRTALYQAKYEADIANKINEPKTMTYKVSGKACESGDIIIHKALLPKASKDDILVVYQTGAYHYSMSSNYNRLLKPAVVFIKEGKVRIVVKRETLEDLVRNDVNEESYEK